MTPTRGNYFEYMRRLPEATAAFQQALALNPHLDDARQALRRLQPGRPTSMSVRSI